ncbi:MAG: hypothetical protein FWE51_04120 [Coriobacteriia bacterium]|nr:hypothetical protein [Coriobacteriia bacterium]
MVAESTERSDKYDRGNAEGSAAPSGAGLGSELRTTTERPQEAQPDHVTEASQRVKPISSSIDAEHSESDFNEIVSITATSASWSYPLPPPELFNQYPPEVQSSMVAWADSAIADESNTQQKIIDAELKEEKVAPWRAMFLFVLCLLLTAFAIRFGESVVAVITALIPVIVPLATSATRRARRGRRD